MGIAGNDKQQTGSNNAKQLRSAAEEASGNNASKSFAAVDPVQRQVAQLNPEDELPGATSLKADPAQLMDLEEEK